MDRQEKERVCEIVLWARLLRMFGAVLATQNRTITDPDQIHQNNEGIEGLRAIFLAMKKAAGADPDDREHWSEYWDETFERDIAKKASADFVAVTSGDFDHLSATLDRLGIDLTEIADDV